MSIVLVLQKQSIFNTKHLIMGMIYVKTLTHIQNEHSQLNYEWHDPHGVTDTVAFGQSVCQSDSHLLSLDDSDVIVNHQFYFI